MEDNGFDMKILMPLAAALLGATVMSAGSFRIQDLGTLGGSQMLGMAIDPLGRVAGYGTDAQGDLRAFTVMNGFTDLTPAGISNAAAYGINGTGQIVGRTLVNGNSQATLWSNGTAQQLGGLGGPDSYAQSINNRQQAAGMATDTQGRGRAVIYSPSGVQDVSLPGASWSSAYGINNSGTIAGYAMNASGGFQAYVWSSGGGYQTLGSLGGGNSYAMAINDTNQVVGNANSGSGYSHAFLWENGSMQDLGTLGGNASYAYGIDGTGSVVGYSLVSNGHSHAFAYIGGAMIDLNQSLTNGTGWELTEAYSINNGGQIAGTGLFNGVQHAFRLDPLAWPVATADGQPVPEPATTVLLGTALAFGLLMIRRRSL